ncbi:1-aminocyclopropane-1-carboxylate oxidase homolog 4-like [Magnolia sinica]|uniref:1-aminocyclopropane-1-carboxylate oxidase homolog 4-like n=1 Tax=Magnolia sinica TaxID=86752 RepID=UPI0026581CEE|nr:1-aminocyclopropane-1-carboxylate oxidase homolog 4-like [Magnolia sinica]
MASGGAVDYNKAKEVKEFDESKMGVKGIVDSGATTIPRFFIHPHENLKALRPPPTTLSIPTIDLSHVNSHRRSNIVEQIREAASTWGFFQITHHGIPTSVLDEVIVAIQSFNEQPANSRSQHYNRDTSTGVSFYTNTDLFRSKAASWGDSLQVILGPDPPVLDRIPEACRREVVMWDEHVRGVGEVLMELLCEGLGLENDRLKELSCLEGRSLVAHYYPYCPEPDLTLGIGAHTDPALLTVLLQNQIAGLQVKHGEEWVEVEPLPGVLVINVGDFLRIISNDEYKSVENRVVANRLRDPRISSVIFFNVGNRGDAYLYGPLQELLSDGKPAIYRNFTMSEYEKSFLMKELSGMSLKNDFKL